MGHSIMLIGAPDTGKTNYLARLWEALRSGTGALKLISAPEIKYVEDALAHLLQGEFAPRSEKNIEESRRDFAITVSLTAGSPVNVVVPDVTGELWKDAVSTLELPEEWMEQLTGSTGALLLVRILSDQNVAPLDWVTSYRLLQHMGANNQDQSVLPTQVLLLELFRFLELKLRRRPDGSRPRVSVIVTAWDRLDADKGSKCPSDYLESEYPLFAGRLEDSEALDVRVFGISVVGGDLQLDRKFQEQFLQGDLKDSGYVVFTEGDSVVRRRDLTIPVTWLLEKL
jgi:hypothetical protein